MQSEQPPRTRVSTEVASRAARPVHLVAVQAGGAQGRQRGNEFVISGDVIRIGKADENDLVLPEETVSRVHCEILRDAKGYLLRDLQLDQRHLPRRRRDQARPTSAPAA